MIGILTYFWGFFYSNIGNALMVQDQLFGCHMAPWEGCELRINFEINSFVVRLDLPVVDMKLQCEVRLGYLIRPIMSPSPVDSSSARRQLLGIGRKDEIQKERYFFDFLMPVENCIGVIGILTSYFWFFYYIGMEKAVEGHLQFVGYLLLINRKDQVHSLVNTAIHHRPLFILRENESQVEVLMYMYYVLSN